MTGPRGFEPGALLAGGRYRLVRSVGRGGTGQVFHAEDTALNRSVAIKVLHVDPGLPEERRARFYREARAAAALSHPNVVPVFDVGEEGGQPFLVQELVDGSTVHQLLDQGALTPSRAIRYAIQAARGIQAAHAAGILHRDLKPSNLIVGSRDGRLRVLDFGLAKSPPDRKGPGSSSDSITLDGLVVGTAHYMSPEQAMGLAVDARSDVFSLAIVTYEMATGRRPFRGETALDVMQAIVRQPFEPLFASGSPLLTALQPVLDRALRKSPEERFPSMDAFALALEEALRLDPSDSQPTLVDTPITGWMRGAAASGASAAPSSGPRPRRRGARALVAAAIGIGLLGGALAVARVLRRGAPPASLRPVQVSTGTGLEAFPAFSPDGGSIVYCSDKSGSFEIYRRPLTPGGTEIALTEDGQQNFQPTFSPDGERVAYHSRGRGGIWVVPSTGGLPRQLCAFGSRPAFSPDGRWVAFESERLLDLSASALGSLPPSVLWLVGAEGGEPRPLTRPGQPGGGHGAAAFSPDGRRVLFASYDRRSSEIWSVEVGGGGLIHVARGSGYRYDPVVSSDGRWLFFCGVSRSWNYGVYRLALASSGSPKGDEEEVANMGLGVVRHLSLSPDGGRLAYTSMSMTSNLWSVPLLAGAPGEPRALTRETGRNSRPALSPDGSRIAFTKWRPGMTQDLWIMNADGTDGRQRTTNPGDDDMGSFLPGGRTLLYLADRDGVRSLRRLDLESGREEMAVEVSADGDFPRPSPDGTRVVFHAAREGGVLNLLLSELSPGALPRAISNDREMAAFPCWSPDGRRLAVEVKRGDATHIGVLPAPGGALTLLTQGPAQRWPYSWAPDNDRIAYAREDGGIWNVFWISERERVETPVTANDRLNVYLRYPAWSPRDDQIVYERAETTGNVWMLETGPATTR